MDVSIVIVSYNTKDLLKECLQSVFRSVTNYEYEIYVVDNHSTDGSGRMARDIFPGVHLIENTANLGFARANNQAIKRAKGQYILLLNPDAFLRPYVLEAMVDFMNEHKGVGACSPMLVYPDGTPQLAYFPFPTFVEEFLHILKLKNLLPTVTGRRIVGRYCGNLLGKAVRSYLRVYGKDKQPREVDCVMGTCMMVRTEATHKVGLLDENFFMYREDVDWCYRMRQNNWKVFYLPNLQVTHCVQQSAKTNNRRVFIESYRSRCYYYRKHFGRGKALLFKGLLLFGVLMRNCFLIPAVLNFKSHPKTRRVISRDMDLVRAALRF